MVYDPTPKLKFKWITLLNVNNEPGELQEDHMGAELYELREAEKIFFIQNPGTVYV